MSSAMTTETLTKPLLPDRISRAPAPICPERLGILLGGVDLVDANRVVGWAQNMLQPQTPVRIEIFIDGVVVANALADRYREDLRRAGIGIGEHGFEVALPPGLGRTGQFTIRRACDGALLEGWQKTVTRRTWRSSLNAGWAAA